MLVILLINLVQERPAIYDSSHPNHRDRDVINALWKDIATALACTEAQCRDKWRQLRSNFMRERRKYSRKSYASGNSQSRRWVFYDAMQFLIPHVTPRLTPDEDTCYETDDAAQDSSPDFIEAPDNASPLKAVSKIETCEDCSSGMPILSKSKKSCFTMKKLKLSKSSEDEMDMHFLDELEQSRAQTASQNDNDGNHQFLLSLLAMMKQLSPIDNMDIRIEIYEAFRRKMFNPTTSVQYGYLTEQNQSHTPTTSPGKMPLLEIATNIPKEKVTNDIILNLSKELSAAVGKPEQYIMVQIVPDQLMSFGGSLEPCGSATVMSIGKLGVEENKAISAKIFSSVEKSLGIPNDRMYIQFVDKPSSEIGFKGTTFHQILGR